MKLLLRAVMGMSLWMVGMTFVFLGLRNMLEGANFWVSMGHAGQGVAATLLGFALMPYSSVSEFLENTFYSKR